MEPQKNTPLILIIEDDPLRQQAMRRVLEAAGYTVSNADAGAAGIELAHQIHPNLIILDEVLPDIRGLDVCRQIKTSPALAGTLVMMISGLRISSDEQAAGLEVGADTYVAWPVSHRELLARVDALIRIGQAEDDLRRERDFADSLVETAPVIVLILGGHGHITRFNPYMEQVSGYQLTDVQGKEWFNTFLPEPDREEARQQFHSNLHQPKASAYVNTILTKNGIPRLIEWYDTPLRDSEGQVTGLLAFGQDITERRQLEAQILQARKMETVGQLAAGMAHDFNNLLTGINGFAELLQMELPPGSQREMADRILSSGNKAARLVSQLLAFARKQMVRPQQLSLNDAVSSLRTRWERECQPGIQVDTHLADDLWPVWMDSQQVEQILLNPVRHLCQNLPEGGPITITTRNTSLEASGTAPVPDMLPGDYIWLSISDAGPGLDIATQQRIFEPFFFTSNEVASDVGLRLAAVHGMVMQNNGHISVASHPGQGTTFHIYLPRSVSPTP